MYEEDDFESGKVVLYQAMKEFTEVTEYHYKDNPAATAAALLSTCRNVYLQTHGPETAAVMFYKMADEMAVMVPPSQYRGKVPRLRPTKKPRPKK
jgi:hypothetical protein